MRAGSASARERAVPAGSAFSSLTLCCTTTRSCARVPPPATAARRRGTSMPPPAGAGSPTRSRNGAAAPRPPGRATAGTAPADCPGAPRSWARPGGRPPARPSRRRARRAHAPVSRPADPTAPRLPLCSALPLRTSRRTDQVPPSAVVAILCMGCEDTTVDGEDVRRVVSLAVDVLVSPCHTPPARTPTGRGICGSALRRDSVCSAGGREGQRSSAPLSLSSTAARQRA